LLINPYNGCSVDCFFCYTKGFNWGYFKTFFEQKIVTVSKDFDRSVSEQLDSINVASCGYLSPVTDPFQLLNLKYKLSEKILKEFVNRNIPIEFITKEKISDEAIELIKQQPHSFGQVSILTLNEDLRKILVPEGATTSELIDNLYKLSNADIYAVCRIDPVLPFINDKRQELKDLISAAIDAGANHIISSCLDIPKLIYDYVIQNIKQYFGNAIAYDYRKLYHESIDNYINADINYRKRLFDFLREECDRQGVTFALCMEYELIDGKPKGLNQEFMSSTNCEGMNIPIYIRVGKSFKPIANCNGACLNCKEAICGINDLAMGKKEDSKKDWRLKDYRRWSQLELGLSS
jgi:DNA repair photolyase